jgi:hypothetical protein
MAQRVPFIVVELGRDADPFISISTQLWRRRSGGAFPNARRPL